MSTIVEQQVAKELRNRILPWILASQEKPSKLRGYAVQLHFYATEIVSVGLGWGLFANPAFKAIGGKEEGALASAGTVSIVFALAWLAFVLWLKREHVAEKLTFHEACRRTFRGVQDEMHKILRSEVDPVKPLKELSQRVEQAFEQHRDAFLVEPESPSIKEAAKKRAQELVVEFRDGWEESLLGPAKAAAATDAGGAK